MSGSNPKIDNYLAIGCGRCALGGTPECKVHKWTKELETMRDILLNCNLKEELKWSVPCYTSGGKNIAIMAALKDHCFISFFKGSLLKDTAGVLVSPGKNSQAVRMFRFTKVEQITTMESLIRAYVKEAIDVEKAGLKVEFKQKQELELPEELLKKMDEDHSFKKAFEALTPGKQRGYFLHFTQPKQSATRLARIEKCIPKIMKGKGFHDR